MCLKFHDIPADKRKPLSGVHANCLGLKQRRRESVKAIGVSEQLLFKLPVANGYISITRDEIDC